MSKFINLYGGGMMPLIDGNKKPNSKVNNNNNKSEKNEKSENNNQKKGENNNSENQLLLNNINNDIQERLSSIKLTNNNIVIGYWICWILIVIFLLSTYITTPIRYSEEEAIYKIESYNRVYYYTYIILLGLVCYYGYTSRARLPLLYGEDTYLKIAPIVVFFLGLIIINIYDSPSVKEDGSFNTAPSNIIKNKLGMSIQYTVLLISIIGLIVLDLYKSSGLLNIAPHHINRCWPVFIVLLVVGNLLYLTINYNVKKYNLPETWRK